MTKEKHPHRTFMAMEIDHLRDVLEIEAEAFKNHWRAQTFFEELANERAHLYVLKEGLRVIGYGGFWLGFEEEAHITTLAVAADYRGRGAGEFLLERLLGAMKDFKVKKATLEVRASNQAAINLYQKFGFVSAGKRKSYYPDGEDALILWLREL